MSGRLLKVLRSPVVWNLASFAFIAAAGLSLNLLIGRVYNASALGVFNQALSVYIVLSQFAVLGVHYSVLQKIAVLSDQTPDNASDSASDTGPQAGPESQALRETLRGALLATAVLSLPLAALGALAAPAIGVLFGSPATAEAWLWLAPAVLFFSINKVLLMALNGLGRMRIFAVANSARYALVLVVLALLWWQAARPEVLTAIFLAAEIALVPLLILLLRRQLAGPTEAGAVRGQARAHLAFGAKSFMSGTFAELNTRVDILVLGIFLSDREVGILVLDMLAVLADRPLLHSGYKLAVVLVNLAANFALVPWLGMTGAALGTAISLGATIVLLIWMGRRCFGLTVP